MSSFSAQESEVLKKRFKHKPITVVDLILQINFHKSVMHRYMSILKSFKSLFVLNSFLMSFSA